MRISRTAVLLHGLYMQGSDMALLRRRLAAAGVDTHQFRYHSWRDSPYRNALALHDYVAALAAPRVDFVCHSLGGLVVRHLLGLARPLPPGRVVTLGTPHQPSAAARRLERLGWGGVLLGRAREQGLLGEVPPWPGARELGSIAGDLRLGLGCFIPGIPTPNDGTVAVAETRLAGMSDHVVVRASHFGLLLSRKAAAQTLAFLETGHFTHTP